MFKEGFSPSKLYDSYTLSFRLLGDFSLLVLVYFDLLRIKLTSLVFTSDIIS